LENARALGFTTLAQVKRERDRLIKIIRQNFKKLKLGDFARGVALDWTVKALDIEALLDEARKANKLARHWIEEGAREIAEEESQTRSAKAA
jgi:hypothetical protein